MKQRLTELKDEIDSSTIIVGVQYLLIMDRTTGYPHAKE